MGHHFDRFHRFKTMFFQRPFFGWRNKKRRKTVARDSSFCSCAYSLLNYEESNAALGGGAV
jgi:hypothetical protein